MKKNIIIPAFVTTLFIAFAFSISAFIKAGAIKEKDENYSKLYFHFMPDDGSEALYETAGSWQNVASQSAPSCPSGSNDPCVIEIESTDLPATVPGNPTPTLEDKLAYKISQQANGTTFVDGLTVREKQ